MTVATLFARIGIKADTDKAREFSGAMKNVAGDLKAAAIGAVAFTAAVVASMRTALDTAKVYRDFQNESGASTDELQRWQAVAAGANVSTSDLAESVKSLAQNREKIKLGQGNMSGFAFLGINPMDDPFSILDQLRQKTAGLPQAMKANLLAQMGVSSQFLQILNLTNAEFDKMRGGAFIIPPSAFAAMNQLQGSLNTFGKMIQWFTSLLAERLAPILDKVIKQVILWVQQNKNGLIDGIVKGTQFILKFVEAIVTVATWVGRIVEGTIGWKNALIAFGVVWAIFNRGLLASPITWIVGGILLLIAVLDDLHAALHINGDNRKSFLGPMLDKNPALKIALEETFGFLKDILKVMSSLFGGDQKGFDKVLKKWGAWGAIIRGIVDSVKWLIDNISKVFIGPNSEAAAANTNLESINGLMNGDSGAAKKEIDDWLHSNFGRGLYGILGDQISDMLGIKNPEAIEAAKKAGSSPSSAPTQVIVTNSSSSPISTTVEIKRDGTRSQLNNVEANRRKAN